MIQINKIIAVAGGTAPYTYQWSTDDSCITFSTASGVTSTSTIETIVSATNETCLTTAVVTLDVTDATGCLSSSTIAIDDKCANLTVTPITKTGTNTFSVTAATPECNTVSIEWIYDTAIYNKVAQTDGDLNSILSLDFWPAIVFPVQSPIKAKITDCYNCTETVTYNNAICIPDPYQLTVYLHYNAAEDNFISGATTFPLPTNCAGYTYTGPLTQPNIALPEGITIMSDLEPDSNGRARFLFTGEPSLAGTIVEGSYTLQDDNGITSTTAEITFIFGTKDDTKTIYVPDKTWNIDCTDIAGDTVTLNIEDELVLDTGVTVDWSSWQVVMNPSAASVPTLSTNIDGDHIISFVLPTPLVNDSFAWVVCDTDGNCTRTVTYTVAECNTPPVAVDDAVVTECGLTEEISVLTNDTASNGVIDINTLELITAPTYGTVTIIAGGKFSYTTNCNVTGADSFTYRFKDSSGVYSNAGTVNLTISCAGVDSNVTLCN